MCVERSRSLALGGDGVDAAAAAHVHERKESASAMFGSRRERRAVRVDLGRAILKTRVPRRLRLSLSYRY